MSNMTPSATITNGQIGKIFDILGPALRKSGLQSESTQLVLETQGKPLATELVAVVRKHVEAVSTTVTRHVHVDCAISPEQALRATGRNQYVVDSVVMAMPKAERGEAEIFFVKRGCHTSDDDWDKHLDSLGFKSCDPVTLCKLNEDDPAFADKHPNVTHWKDADDNWCYAAFARGCGGHDVGVDCVDRDWPGHWWFACVRK